MMAESPTQSRRLFLAGAAKAAGAALAIRPLAVLAQEAATQQAKPDKDGATPVFSADDPAWKRTWYAAVAVLADNIRNAPSYSKPLLFEGSTYQGAWLEC